MVRQSTVLIKGDCSSESPLDFPIGAERWVAWTLRGDLVGGGYGLILTNHLG
jgi:hypothetical protein